MFPKNGKYMQEKKWEHKLGRKHQLERRGEEVSGTKYIGFGFPTIADGDQVTMFLFTKNIFEI